MRTALAGQQSTLSDAVEEVETEPVNQRQFVTGESFLCFPPLRRGDSGGFLSEVSARSSSPDSALLLPLFKGGKPYDSLPIFSFEAIRGPRVLGAMGP